MEPSILNDSTSFWLDFAGSRLPETSKSEEKLRLEISVFFNIEKNVEDRFFQISGSILTSVLEPGAAKKCDIRYSIFVFFLEGSFSQFGLAFSFQGSLSNAPMSPKDSTMIPNRYTTIMKQIQKSSNPWIA